MGLKTVGCPAMAADLGLVWMFAGLDLTPTAPSTEPLHADGPEIWVPVESGALAQLTHAVACVSACQDAGAGPAAVLGHSFGELPALVAARALSAEQAERLARARARAMAALPAGRSGMLAVVGLDARRVQRTCVALRRLGLNVAVAAFNGPDQTVVAGPSADLQRASAELLAAGASRVRRVPVPVAAHTPAARPVRAAVAAELQSMRLRRPSVPVYSALTSQSTTDPETLRDWTVRSIVAPVDWTGVVSRLLRDGFNHFMEIGVGVRPALLGPILDTAAAISPAPLVTTTYIADQADAPDGLAFAGRRISHRKQRLELRSALP